MGLQQIGRREIRAAGAASAARLAADVLGGVGGGGAGGWWLSWFAISEACAANFSAAHLPARRRLRGQVLARRADRAVQRAVEQRADYYLQHAPGQPGIPAARSA